MAVVFFPTASFLSRDPKEFIDSIFSHFVTLKWQYIWQRYEYRSYTYKTPSEWPVWNNKSGHQRILSIPLGFPRVRWADKVVGHFGSIPVFLVRHRCLNVSQQLPPSVSLLSLSLLPSVLLSLSRRPNKHGGSGRGVASSRHECREDEITAQDRNYDTVTPLLHSSVSKDSKTGTSNHRKKYPQRWNYCFHNNKVRNLVSSPRLRYDVRCVAHFKGVLTVIVCEMYNDSVLPYGEWAALGR